MPEEARPGVWHVSWAGGEPPKVLDQHNRLVATVAGEPESTALARAGLIAAAPALYDAVDAALMVFRVMAEHGDEKAAAVGADMIPAMQSALDGGELPWRDHAGGAERLTGAL